MGSLSTSGGTHRGPTDGGIRHRFSHGLTGGQNTPNGTVMGRIWKCSPVAGMSPELRCWRLQVGNLKIDSVGRLWRRRSPPSEGSQLVVPVREN